MVLDDMSKAQTHVIGPPTGWTRWKAWPLWLAGFALLLHLGIAVSTGLGHAASIPFGSSPGAALGDILYTDYIFYFQTSGLILLVAMIGAIVLTLRHRPGVKRQPISRQVARNPASAVELKDVKPGEGS